MMNDMEYWDIAHLVDGARILPHLVELKLIEVFLQFENQLN